MTGVYKRSEIKTHIYDSKKVDAEVKKVIEKKENDGTTLKEVCKLLNRDAREIYRILKRMYRPKLYLRKD